MWLFSQGAENLFLLNNWKLDRRRVISISQQMELRYWVQNRRLKIVGIGAGNRDTDTITLAKKVRGRQEVKRQLNGLAWRDRSQVALVMSVVRQSQIIIGG